MKKFISFILCFVICMGFLPVVPASAATERIVKVGYVIYDNYQQGGEGEEKSGFGYDYLQKISYYNGWKYEYVYGNFTELYEQLKRGEIDLLNDVSYTEQRKQEVLLSKEPEGTEDYYIYSRKKSTLNQDSLNLFLLPQVVGFNKGSAAERYFLEWKEKNDVSCQTIAFRSEEERSKYLAGNGITMVVATDLMSYSLSKEGWYPFERVGRAQYYFAVSPNRSDLWMELNSAQERILAENPNYVDELRRNYQVESIEVKKMVSAGEKEYIIRHGVFRIGYMMRYAPLAAIDRNGELTGILSSITQVMKENFHMELETVGFQSGTELMEALEDGTVDMIFPVTGNSFSAEKNGWALSNPLAKSSMTAIFSGEYHSGIFNRIAVTRDSIAQSVYVKLYYPDAELIYADTFEDGLKLVFEGKADSIFMITECYNVSKKDFKEMNHLSSTVLPNTMDLCVAISNGDKRLISIINKAINNYGVDGLQSELIRYATIESTYSFRDWLSDRIGYFIVGIVVLILGILLTAYIIVRRNNRTKESLAILNEEAQEARRAAEDANRAKTEFLNHMSHDIRTPINGIMGLLEMIQKNWDDEKKVDEYLRKIRTSSGHLLSLVNDVLDMSKLESGKTTFDQIPIDVLALSREINDLLDTQYQNANIRYTGHVLEIQHPYIYGSPIHIKQIILNLGNNALKYNKKGGSVDVYLKEIEQEDNTALYRFEIVDTGIGMTKDFIDNQLFEPFTQADSEARTKYKGTGLGMSIVKKLVTQMGGRISVESLVGVGSTFTVEIPFQICEKQEFQEVVSGDNGSIAGMNLLLVEDNELNMEIVEFLLEDENVTYTKASNGQEALNAFKESNEFEYDMILMDVMMPVMNGLEATRFIRSLNRKDAKTIPIIAMTANAFVEDAIKSREAGMNDHLAKPLERDSFLATIAKWRK